MPADDINYRYTENGIVYDFYDVFVPAEIFRQPALWTWGNPGFGQLGINNDTVSKTTPVTTILGGTNWKSVSAGYHSIAAIKTDGTLWTCGYNGYALLGNNSTVSRSTPVTTFAGGNNWKQVDVGSTHMAAIKTDGTLWTWGRALNGILGNGITTGIISTPVTTFAGGTNWKQVSCGDSFTAAIKTDGTLWTWGTGSFGQLGNNLSSSISIPVTTILGGTNWKSVSCGYTYAAAIKTDGTLWVWGRNSVGQLGINDIVTRNTPVTTFLGGTNWKSAVGGRGTTAAIKTDGTLWVWGNNFNGQLGINATTSRTTPVTTILGGTNWKSVACNASFTAAIKTDGTLWTWGSNGTGELGINDTATRSTPVTTFLGGNNWKSVANGYGGAGFHTAAIQYVPDP
jgi:alpha-tubulin suppressor-like RCC1 family protein